MRRVPSLNLQALPEATEWTQTHFLRHAHARASDSCQNYNRIYGQIVLLLLADMCGNCLFQYPSHRLALCEAWSALIASRAPGNKCVSIDMTR